MVYTITFFTQTLQYTYLNTSILIMFLISNDVPRFHAIAAQATLMGIYEKTVQRKQTFSTRFICI